MKKIRVLKISITVILHFLLTITVQSQVITSVPPTAGNDRYFDEIFSEMKRPGLSIIGFDNSGIHDKGYGLKQILNQVYISGTNEQKELFKIFTF